MYAVIWDFRVLTGFWSVCSSQIRDWPKLLVTSNLQIMFTNSRSFGRSHLLAEERFAATQTDVQEFMFTAMCHVNSV